MKTIKPQRLSLLTRTYEYEGKFYLAANIMAFISFDQPRRLLSEQSMWKFAATALGKDTVLDTGMPKQYGEYLVYGKCHAPPSSTATGVMVQAKVGALEKTLAVMGQRYWERSALGRRASEPVPFSTLDLNYTHAFGGEGFANNPVGKGMPPLDATQQHFLPQIEMPDSPVTFIDDRPQPAGLAPLDFTWPQRMSKAGTYDDAWLKTRFPGYAADMDWSIFNTAQPDQWLPNYFSGDESFEITGMHPDKPVVRGQLPACAVRCFLTLTNDASLALREVPTRAETLVLFPGSERAIVMFRGVTEITTDDGADIAHILVGAEDMATRKPLAHYQSVLSARLDKKNGAIHSLIDEPLLPNMPASNSKGDALDVSEMDALVRPKMLLRKNMLSKARKMLEDSKLVLVKTRADLVEAHQLAGMPPPDLAEIDKALATTIEPDPEPPKLEELPDLKAKLEKILEDAKADAAVKKAEAEALLRRTCTEQKLDFEKIMAEAKTQGSGPPKPMHDQIMGQLRSTAEDLKAQGVISPELDKQLADKALPVKLKEGDAALMKVYRNFAHVYPAVGAYSAQDNTKARDELVKGMAGGEKFAGRDFSGADFSGLKLKGGNFAGALLEGVNFSRADLTSADFSDAVLARGVFTGATLAKANFTGANMGFAKLAGVDASAAKLAGADLSRINLRDADLSKCDLMGAHLAGADFSGVNAPGVRFIQIDFMPAEDAKPNLEGLPELLMAGIKFVGARLAKAMFLNCRMDDADFSGACLDGAVFLTAQGSRINFSGASLKGFCAVKDCLLQRANFTGANLQKANFRGTNLHLSVFLNATLADADLSECLLTSTNFKAASATNLQLVKVKLSGADFSGANLQQVNLQKADMKGALFFGTNLYMADFLCASSDETTIFERANLQKTLLKKAEK